MYNTQKPSLDELPSTARLVKSTVLAAIAAIAILVTVVLPAEYAIDPTGIGQVIGLTPMGEIKNQLHEEAEMDRKTLHNGDEQRRWLDSPINDSERRIDLALGVVLKMFIGTSHAQSTGTPRTETFTLTLAPGQGIEVKLVMQEGAEVNYQWTATGGLLNFDLHGDGENQEVSYEKGRGSAGAEGILTAPFSGNHGWFWRNRDHQDVTVMLTVTGDFEELKQTY